MKAIRIHGYKQVPIIEDVPIPGIGPDEVLVRVEAVAMNPLEGKLLGGDMRRFFPLSFPYTMGTDITGTIERLGANVVVWHVGERVIARPTPRSGGAFAEFAAVPADLCASLPAPMPITDAAGIPTAACTAWKALFEVAKLKAGQSVLIHAGAGGVGSFAVQLAHSAGAHVIATASGNGVALVESLGADKVVDYRNEKFGDLVSDVDIVLDTVGGDTQTASFDVLRPGGYLASIVQPPDEAMAKDKGVLASMVMLDLDGELLQTTVNDIWNRSIKVLTDRVLPLAKIGEALERQMSGHARGKIILTHF